MSFEDGERGLKNDNSKGIRAPMLTGKTVYIREMVTGLVPCSL